MRASALPATTTCIHHCARLPQANRPIQGRGHWRTPVGPMSRPKSATE
ncbi:hypothetical protein L4174_013450 [Photobacterium sp. CCB-ST2H9]|nr:hypothetical protein [Photobacterium sp. CCB-ST2H9]UTM56807.1 hypothetical protein L4174_013450 [Photobacterium sp. CCB-ST2H9]